MSQRALRHIGVAKPKHTYCVPYLRTYSAHAAVRPLPQETGTSSDANDTPSSEPSSSKVTLSKAGKPLILAHPLGRKNKTSSAKNDPDAFASTRKEKRQFLKTEAYLAKLHAGGVKPSITDLEMFRLDKHARADSRKYVEQHSEIMDGLCRAFTKDQLREFLISYNVVHRASARKTELAELIIERGWGWPSLAEIEKAKRERTEVSSQLFHMTRNELFIILGKDGSQMLELSREFNVNISLSSDPLALRVEGVIASLKGVADRISELKRSLVYEVYQLPTAAPVPQDLTQRISRLANAYLENIGLHGQLKLSARDQTSLTNAKRLTARALHEVHISSNIPILCYKPPESIATKLLSAAPHAYSLYPFFSPRAVPWTMNTTGAFRMRKVGEWLLQSQGEDVERTGGLAGGTSKVYTQSLQPVDLRSAFQNMLADVNQRGTRTRKIKASLGHMLISTRASSQHPPLIPPIKGYHKYDKIMNWLETHKLRTAFISSLPSILVDAKPRKQKILHRLVYKSYKTLTDPEGFKLSGDSEVQITLPEVRSITFEVVLAQPEKTPVYDPGFNPEPSANDVEGEQDDLERGEDDIHLSSAAPKLAQMNVQLSPQCWTGRERVLYLMMPDRPMDMHLSFIDSTEITATQAPSGLKDYLSDLQNFLLTTDPTATQPIAPLLLSYNGEEYVLHTSASVRQSIEEGPADPSPAVVSESSVDLESSQKTTQCEVVCSDPLSENDWTQFLKTCDRLTCTAYTPTWKNMQLDRDLDFL